MAHLEDMHNGWCHIHCLNATLYTEWLHQFTYILMIACVLCFLKINISKSCFGFMQFFPNVYMSTSFHTRIHTPYPNNNNTITSLWLRPSFLICRELASLYDEGRMQLYHILLIHVPHYLKLKSTPNIHQCHNHINPNRHFQCQHILHLLQAHPMSKNYSSYKHHQQRQPPPTHP